MVQTASTMLPLGGAAPDFSLPDVQGRQVSLSDFADAPAVLVIFMCNHCPYVKHVAAGLADLAMKVIAGFMPSSTLMVSPSWILVPLVPPRKLVLAS